jgi:hypothetical protein
MKPPESCSAPQGPPVAAILSTETRSTMSNDPNIKIKTNQPPIPTSSTTTSPPPDKLQAFFHHLLEIKEDLSESSSSSRDELDFLGPPKLSHLPPKASKQTIANRTISIPTTKSGKSAPTKPTPSPNASTKAIPTKLSDFTEIEEEPNYENGENTPIHPELQEDTLIELLMGLKYITTTLTRDVFEETKTEMLKIIGHAIQKAKADAKHKPLSTNSNLTTATSLSLSYAAIAAKQQQRDTTRKQRIQTEVNLALPSNFNPDALANQVQRPDLPEETLKQIMEEHINSGIKTTGKTPRKIQLLGVKRIAKGLLKLICGCPEDADTIRSINWNSILGATVAKPNYGTVLHGVSKEDIDPTNPAFDMKHTVKVLNSQNPGVNITRITTLMRKPKNPNAPTHSIILFTEDPKEADHLILRGARVANRIHAAQKYTPQFQVTRCFNCQGFGHKAQVCTRKQRCGKCSGDHKTAECKGKETDYRCALCQGNHKAWEDECPKKKEEINKLKYLRNTTTPTFDNTA